MNTSYQEDVIVLLDNQRYRLCTNWINAKDSVGVSSVAVLTDGRLAVLLRGQPAKLRLFDTDARQVDEWELLGRCRITAVYGHSISCAPDGQIFVAEMMPDRVSCLVPIF